MSGARVPFGGPRDQRRELLDRLRPDDDVDQARALQDLGAFLLRHAAGDGDERPMTGLLRRSADLAEPGEQLLLGALADAAGVDDDDVGGLRRRRRT
jgi:hypothetical protein